VLCREGARPEEGLVRSAGQIRSKQILEVDLGVLLQHSYFFRLNFFQDPLNVILEGDFRGGGLLLQTALIPHTFCTNYNHFLAKTASPVNFL
jgi:hypothetical protein